MYIYIYTILASKISVPEVPYPDFFIKVLPKP